MRELKPDCRQCAHFERYYIKKNGGFVSVLNGTCLKRKLNAKERRQFPLIEDCEQREPVERRKEVHREEVEKALQEIAERLGEIAQFLREEE